MCVISGFLFAESCQESVDVVLYYVVEGVVACVIREVSPDEDG